MRTTLKRGVGRLAGANGNGKAVFPPGTVSAVTRYRQPPPPVATGLGLFRRVLLITLLAVSSLALGGVGGGYLYTHQFVANLRARTPAVVKAAKALDIPVANRAAIALVIGYDHRQGVESNHPSLSDTLMLIRADPTTKTISLLSFPRDLDVPIYCGATPITTDRINSAYGRCNAKGSLLTVKHLTGLPVNYLITVNFHGFKQVVDTLGGIWMDVDRRYYNKNTGAYYNNFANINLQPGYQKLSGQQALDFVRFRHTDSDLTRNARQQQFVRAFKEQVARSFSFRRIPSLVDTITKNIEVGEGGHALQLDQVISYALFAQSLPGGHLFQEKIENVQCGIECTASSTDLQAAVDRFQNPDVQEPDDANAAALGPKIKQSAPPPSSVTVTVLNGNGVAGAAANASYLLGQRGYRTLTPPNNVGADSPVQTFHSKIYYDPAQKRSKAAAVALQNLMQPADVAKLPRAPKLRALDPGSMLMVVLGQTFHGTMAPLPVHNVPTHQQPTVRYDAGAAELLRPFAKKVPFKLMVPTVVERSSSPDTLPGDKPISYYWMDASRKNKGVRLVFHNGGNEFWGVQETDFTAAPALGDRSFHRILGGRAFDLYYSGNHLHMVVLRQGGSTYWVVNTLLDALSNETMLAIAKGLKPLTSIH
ncbi:MAG: polyisoprenyl-teichoic acid--peptidoglycan teichoic acid transferase [Gaiellaceae bacterium]|nr:polyisoprenyl-teichoic acid--peptidoglycan teichoic acid transferase [Gaiellaceae bacterium]